VPPRAPRHLYQYVKLRESGYLLVCLHLWGISHNRIALIALYRLAYAILAIFAVEFFLHIAYCHMTEVERPVLLPVIILMTRNRALKPFLFEIE
jgi:hypothetical protein